MNGMPLAHKNIKIKAVHIVTLIKYQSRFLKLLKSWQSPECTSLPHQSWWGRWFSTTSESAADSYFVTSLACREPMMASPVDIVHNLAVESEEAASQEQHVQ